MGMQVETQVRGAKQRFLVCPRSLVSEGSELLKPLEACLCAAAVCKVGSLAETGPSETMRRACETIEDRF